MNNKFHVFVLFILVLTVFAFELYRTRLSYITEEPTNVEKRDTVFMYKTDTIIEYKTRYVEKRTVDTVFVEVNNTILPLPIVQKYFHKKNVYDLWVSGVEPLSLDSLIVYKQTEYATITKIEESRGVKLYAGGGLFSFRETITPYVGVSSSFEEKWLISANFGLNGCFGVDVKFKIFEHGKKY